MKNNASFYQPPTVAPRRVPVAPPPPRVPIVAAPPCIPTMVAEPDEAPLAEPIEATVGVAPPPQVTAATPPLPLPTAVMAEEPIAVAPPPPVAAEPYLTEKPIIAPPPRTVPDAPLTLSTVAVIEARSFIEMPPASLPAVAPEKEAEEAEVAVEEEPAVAVFETDAAPAMSCPAVSEPEGEASVEVIEVIEVAEEEAVAVVSEPTLEAEVVTVAPEAVVVEPEPAAAVEEEPVVAPVSVATVAEPEPVSETVPESVVESATEEPAVVVAEAVVEEPVALAPPVPPVVETPAVETPVVSEAPNVIEAPVAVEALPAVAASPAETPIAAAVEEPIEATAPIPATPQPIREKLPFVERRSLVERHPAFAERQSSVAEPVSAERTPFTPPAQVVETPRPLAMREERRLSPETFAPAKPEFSVVPAPPEGPPTEPRWRVLRLSGDQLVPIPHALEGRTLPIALRSEETPESFFHLYATLERLAAGQTVLGVTSAISGEGATTVALHLALSIARSTYNRVCLVDLSMGEDTLCRRVGAAPAPYNLMDCLEEERALAALDWPGPESLTLLPAGRKPANPARTARAPRVADLIAAVRAAFDVVIVDLPAISSDNAVPLAQHLDGVVLVARAGATPRALIRQAIATLGPGTVAGVVLNRVTTARRQTRPGRGKS